jgi:hypothetical protein
VVTRQEAGSPSCADMKPDAQPVKKTGGRSSDFCVGIGPQGTDQRLRGDRPRVQVNGCGAMSAVTAHREAKNQSRRQIRPMKRPRNRRRGNPRKNPPRGMDRSGSRATRYAPLSIQTVGLSGDKVNLRLTAREPATVAAMFDSLAVYGPWLTVYGPWLIGGVAGLVGFFVIAAIMGFVVSAGSHQTRTAPASAARNHPAHPANGAGTDALTIQAGSAYRMAAFPPSRRAYRRGHGRSANSAG